jgi:hypothetical protein
MNYARLRFAARFACMLLLAALAAACRGGETRGACDPSPPPGSLGTICGFSNPEDVAHAPAASLLLVSQMRHPGQAAAPPRSEAQSGEVHPGEAPGGSLAALHLGPEGEPVTPPRKLWPLAEAAREAGARDPIGDPRCTDPPDPARFAPHGLAAGAPGPDGAIRVAVVGHGVREAVELFAVRGGGEAATLGWTGCIPLPEDAVGNDVWLDETGDLWVTNYQPALGGLAGLYHTVRGGLGLPTGEVLRWRSSGSSPPGWQEVPGTRGANPNGLLLMPGGTTLAVAYTGSRRVVLRPLAASGSGLEIEVGGHPDNLALASRGTLLALVHTSSLASLGCRLGSLPCTSPWKLIEIDPFSGLASERFAHDGSLLGGVSSVAQVGERLYFGAIFDDRIGVLETR